MGSIKKISQYVPIVGTIITGGGVLDAIFNNEQPLYDETLIEFSKSSGIYTNGTFNSKEEALKFANQVDSTLKKGMEVTLQLKEVFYFKPFGCMLTAYQITKEIYNSYGNFDINKNKIINRYVTIYEQGVANELKEQKVTNFNGYVYYNGKVCEKNKYISQRVDDYKKFLTQTIDTYPELKQRYKNYVFS